MQQKHTSKKSSLKFLAVVITSIFLLSSAVAYFATNGFKRTTQDQANVTEEQPSKEVVSTVEPKVDTADSVQLVQNTLEGGQPAVCNFQYQAQTGTAHINSDSQFRIDMGTDKGLVHVIKRDSSAYLWTNGQPNGIVFSNQEQDAYERNFGGLDPLTLERQAKENSINNLDCKNQPFDNTRLTLPDDVNFKSYTDLTDVHSEAEDKNSNRANEKLSNVRDMVEEKWEVLSEFKYMTIPSDRSVKKFYDNNPLQMTDNLVKPRQQSNQ